MTAGSGLSIARGSSHALVAAKRRRMPFIALNGMLIPAPPHPCREIGLSEIAAQDHVPGELLSQLTHVAADGVAAVAALNDELPVAFAYAAAETESLWDVSIDTIPSHRRQGYATTAVCHLMRRMREQGKSAVWGAVESNQASASLARCLGFVETDRLWILSRRTTQGRFAANDSFRR
jgi:hypothetical protein